MKHLFLGLVALAAAACAQQTPVVQVSVQPDTTFQTIEGWGTCLVSWDPQMQAMYRKPEFQRLYVQEMGFNFLRVNIWGPVSTSAVADPEAIVFRDFDFSVDGGRASIFIEFAQAIKQLDPNVRVIGTVWSPPAWMKENNSLTDAGSGAIMGNAGYGDKTNRVKRSHYSHFAHWLAEYAKAFENAGVPFWAVSPGNEVQFTQGFESCVWTAEDFAEILALTGDVFEKEGLGDVLLFGPETMTGHLYEGGTPSYVKALMANPRAAAQLDAWATHGYEDGVKGDVSENSSRGFWELVKDTGKPAWVTEGGTGDHAWPAPVTRGAATAIHNSLVASHASVWVPWQISDMNENEHGLMVGERKTKKTYAVQHFSRFIRPGAVRLGCEPSYGELLTSAYRNTDGSVVVVLINPESSSRTVRLSGVPANGRAYRTSASEDLRDLGAVSGSLSLPGHSIMTVVLR